jgi:hypothetical protein
LADRLSVALLDLVGFGFPSARTVVLAIVATGLMVATSTAPVVVAGAIGLGLGYLIATAGSLLERHPPNFPCNFNG